jgi:3-hydroxybutyryl-CoA dehydrogenase
MAEIRKVAVVGAGTMGSQIALQTAMSGRYRVALVDADQAQAERAVAQNRRLMDRAVARGRATDQSAAETLSAIAASSDFDAAVADADLVIEAVFESLEPKRDVFRRADQTAPEHAILATNSSTIGISRLADVTGRPDRCCNMHFFHPVTVMQLCEIVRGPKTSDATVAAAMEFVRSINRVPVLINKEVHGFIVNRILFAASEEAMNLLEGGYSSVEDIDLAVKKGLNWPMGPFELMDFSGLDIMYGALLDRKKLGEGGEVPAVLKDKVDRGDLGRKTGKGFYDHPAADPAG